MSLKDQMLKVQARSLLGTVQFITEVDIYDDRWQYFWPDVVAVLETLNRAQLGAEKLRGSILNTTVAGALKELKEVIAERKPE